MAVCPQCGAENRDEARFCDSCGAGLATLPTGAREERKVVTVLFADLVGFTGRAEQMDPEDVRALLSPYYAHVRAELERYGGTVEKFIGDAVMALFGAPVAHEDDPERAVRAALTIRDWAREQGEELHLRVAVTTGEALVALGARPSEGEGMASGDVVNTAARLQSAAPIDGILVDETTYRATSQKIEYRPAEPIEAKGKQEPIAAWEAIEARASFGVDTVQGSRAPLIGREHELQLLVDTLARVRREREPQLVTLVGVPGIGKSRLVYELFQAIEQDPDLIYWRQGRSLPYGEGVSFWALSEMVKAHAGILETDSPAETEEKLRRGVADLIETDESDADWVARHLRPLVGLEGGQELHGDRRAEAFAGWRRFLESIADERPLVLVFEDLHWADEGLLDFVDHLVDWAGGVPILIVCTARPELLSRRTDWGGGKPNAVTLSLSPLDDEETARLLAALLERSVLPAETQSALLQRAGGNPLYAEEFVRMVQDRGLLLSSGDGDLPLPESVQGIVAARLDALPDDEKVLLQDAAVLGKVFWLGAALQLAGLERAAAENALHLLERKEFVRRERRSSVANETEYAFRHLIVRDVAYGQIPRARRAEKHRLAAEWIEALGRPDDHAEMLAHHYLTALELARASGEDTAALTERARLTLREAGDRAFALSAHPAAASFYGAALELWPADDPERPSLLLRYGRMLGTKGPGLNEGVLTEARDAFLETGERGAAAEAEVFVGESLWLRGRFVEASERLSSAEALARDVPTSPSKAYVVSSISRFLMLAGESENAIRVGHEALAMAEELGLDDVRVHALTNIGSARKTDAGGRRDLEQAIEIAAEINSPEGIRAYGNLANLLATAGKLEESFAMAAEARRFAERFGHERHLSWLRAELARPAYFDGRWNEASEQFDRLIEEFEQSGFWMNGPCHCWRGRIRLGRGDVEGAKEDAERAIELSQAGLNPQVEWPALALGARVFAGTDPVRANDLFNKTLVAGRSVATVAVTGEGSWLIDQAAAALHLSRQDDLLDAISRGPGSTIWVEAAVALVSGEPLRAAEIYAAAGDGPDEAWSRLRAAELLVGEGRRAEADAQLRQALAFWRAAGAKAYVREGEALLAASA